MSKVERYEIRVEGHLDEKWRDWFDGLAIRNEPNGETTLLGPVADQVALHGLLARIRDLNLRLVALNRLGPSEVTDEAETKDVDIRRENR